MAQDQKNNKFYVTTPIYYVTARPHLGSLYSTLLADVVARWHKLEGKKTFFLTGTDEHGQKVAQAAQAAGKDPQDFVNGFIPAYQDVWKAYGIEYNHFIRTTDHAHKKAVQGWLQQLIKQGDIYKGFYEGWYCTPCETFVTEKDAEITSAPHCPSCGRDTQLVSEETYFFRLSAYQDKLLAFYQAHPDFVAPKERMNEIINFVKAGLKDLSVSRTTVSWGIPFPGDERHVTYVWADALNNYVTGVGYGQSGHQEEFAFWWPADMHIMGKDIIRFHGVFWPAFLMAAGLEMPKKLLVHGWIQVNKQKMSKSLGNAVDPVELLEKYGAEPVRYYLMRQMSISQDGEFSFEDLEQRISSDLANDLGNLLNRMTSLAEKHNLYEVPASKIWSEAAIDLRDACENMVQDTKQFMDDATFHLALARVWKFINQVNAYFHSQEPWKWAKIDRDAFVQVLSATLHSLKAIGIMLWPVMPHKMDQLLESIGAPLKIDGKTIDDLELGFWAQTFMLRKIPNLFDKPEPRDVEEVKAPVVQEQSAVKQPEAGQIGIEDFLKVDLVVGTITSCEEIPASDKMFKLMVDCGSFGVRQILSGVKQAFKAEELLGKQGVFVLNLKPRKMLGMESHGMMLFAKREDGSMAIATVGAVVANGTKLG